MPINFLSILLFITICDCLLTTGANEFSMKTRMLSDEPSQISNSNEDLRISGFKNFIICIAVINWVFGYLIIL